MSRREVGSHDSTTRRGLAALVICAAATARAEVTRVTVTSRADVAFAGYEKIVGRVFFAVDPADPRNAIVVDLDKAPRMADGRVEFSSDFTITRPKSGGNGVAIVDIVNRGRATVIPNFNRAGGRNPDVGDGFLLKRGFTVVTVGWEFDLPSADMIRIDVPVATDAGRPITGMVRASFTPDRRDPFRVGDLAVYAPVDSTDPASTLTVRDTMAGAAETIPRGRWTLSGATVTLEGGFEAGRIYELSFRAANPPVGGLGFVAVRDFASWIKHDPSALATARYAYAFGNSQSGRFLRTFLYQGFNSDERGRQVLDAVMANIAGSRAHRSEPAMGDPDDGIGAGDGVSICRPGAGRPDQQRHRRGAREPARRTMAAEGVLFEYRRRVLERIGARGRADAYDA